MARKTICPFCGESFDRDQVEFVKYKNRYYHKSCYETFTAADSDRINLEQYIQKLFGLVTTGPIINKQIKKFHDELGFTYFGIQQTLKYFYEIRQNDLNGGNRVGIGIVPYVYQQAREYYRQMWTIEQLNHADLTLENTREIVIKKPERAPIQGVKPIDMKE